MSGLVLLPERKAKAVELILCGMTDGEIAEELGVRRQTVNKWRNHNPDFCTYLEKRRKELYAYHQDAINALVFKAIGVLHAAMNDEDKDIRLRAAQAVFRTTGLQAFMRQSGAQSKEDVIEEFLREMIGEVSMELGFGNLGNKDPPLIGDGGNVD